VTRLVLAPAVFVWMTAAKTIGLHAAGVLVRILIAARLLPLGHTITLHYRYLKWPKYKINHLRVVALIKMFRMNEIMVANTARNQIGPPI